MNATIIITATIIAISFASILIRLCDAPALIIASYRLTFAALFMLIAIQHKHLKAVKKLDRRDWLLAAFAGLFLSLHFIAWISSLSYTSVASSVVLVSSTPIFVGIGSWLFLKEKLSGKLLIGIGLTLVGAIVLGFQDTTDETGTFRGDALALLGAAAIAGYFLIGRSLRKKMDNLTYVSLVYSISALLLILLAFLAGQPFVGYSLNVYILLFLIAFVPQSIGHTGLNWALKHFSATAVAVLTLSEPIGASILAFFLLGEQIAGVQFLGGALVIAGVAIAIWGESRKQ